MEPNQTDNKGHQKPKRKAVKVKQADISIGKALDILSHIGDWSAGVAAIFAPIVWFWFHPSWAFWTALVALPLLSFAICRRTKRKKGVLLVIVVLTTFTSVSIGLLFPPKQQKEIKFSLVCGTFFGANSRDEAPHFFYVNDTAEGVIAYPVHIAMNVMFTNLKPTPMTIDGYRVETEITNVWRKVYSIDVRYGAIYQSYMITNAMRVNVIGAGGIFNSAIEGKAILPHMPVFGMLFLEMPKGGVGERWRFCVREADGSESCQMIQFSPATPADEAPVQRLGFHTVEQRDLTKEKMRYYHEE